MSNAERGGRKATVRCGQHGGRCAQSRKWTWSERQSKVDSQGGSCLAKRSSSASCSLPSRAVDQDIFAPADFAMNPAKLSSGLAVDV